MTQEERVIAWAAAHGMHLAQVLVAERQRREARGAKTSQLALRTKLRQLLEPDVESAEPQTVAMLQGRVAIAIQRLIKAREAMLVMEKHLVEKHCDSCRTCARLRGRMLSHARDIEAYRKDAKLPIL